MIVRLDADGAVVADADDCSAVHVRTALDTEHLRATVLQTGTGSVAAVSARFRAVITRARPSPSASRLPGLELAATGLAPG